MLVAGTSNSPERLAKRRKATSATAWLDLEAQVSAEESDDDEEDWELDDDFIVHNEPELNDATTSHAQLLLEHERVGEVHGGWFNFLERVQTRSRSDSLSNEMDEAPRTFVGGVPIWKVPVKHGWEEKIVFKILERELTRKGGPSPILSATGRVSCPCFVLVETHSVTEVQAMAAGIANFFGWKASIMPPDLIPECLNSSNIWTPCSPGWVRLMVPPYNKDLAFIYDVDERSLLPTLITVPRLDHTLPGDKKLLSRPNQGLFNAPLIRASFGSDSVEKSGSFFIYEDNAYDKDGYLVLKTMEFYLGDASPTAEELFLFQQCSQIPTRWMHTTLDQMKSQTLEIGNKVKILKGEFPNINGTLTAIEGGTVEVSVPGIHSALNLSISQIRKQISIGDEVVVTAGPHARFTGWVVAIGNGNVELFNHESCKQVAVPIPFVEFWSAEIVTHLIRNNSGILVRKTIDPNDYLVGRHVQIIKKSTFKSYQGIVKEVRDNDFAIVELNATLKRQRVRLANLTMINDEKKRSLKPLGEGRSEGNSQPAGENQLMKTVAPRFEIPRSIRPLEPSTPLPSPLTGPVSPAWDPASRTPVVPSTPYTWMTSPFLSGKCIKVELHGTKPVLKDTGFKYGDHEGQRGLWTGTDDAGNATVMLGLHTTLSVPFKYVRTIRPSLRGQTVVAIEGAFVGGEYIVLRIGSLMCTVKPRKGQPGNVSLEIGIADLAVIA